MSKLLINEPPLQVLPSLALKIGLNEAMVLQQIHYWISNPRVGKQWEGRNYIRNSVRQWKEENFPFWSEATIKRALTSLRENGILITTDSLNFADFDATLWYTIDYDVLESVTKSLGQNDLTGKVKMTKPEPESRLVKMTQPIYIEEESKNREFTPPEKTELPDQDTALDDLTDPTSTDHQKAELAKRVGAHKAHPIYKLLQTKAQYCNPSKVLIATAIGIIQNITEEEVLGIIEWKTKNKLPPYPSEIVGNLTLYREYLLSQSTTPPGPPAVSPAIQALYARTIGQIASIPTNDALKRKKCRESWPQAVQDGVLRLLNDKKAKSLDRVSLADFAAYCGGGL